MRKLFILFILLISLIQIGCMKHESDIYTGYIEADITKISAIQSGTITDVLVKEGDFVHLNDMIAQQDDRTFHFSLDKSLSQLTAKETAFNKMIDGATQIEIEQIKTKIGSIASQIASSEADKSNLEISYNDAKALYESGAISEYDFNNKALSLEKSQKNLDALYYQKKELELKLEDVLDGADSKDILILEQEVNAAQSDVDQVKLQIENCKMKASANGYIRDVYYNVGEFIPAGSTVADIVEADSMYVQFYVEEKNLQKINLKESVQITINGLDERIQGTIYYISPTGQFTPKNIESKENRQEMVYKVKASVDSSDNIRPGMMVDVELEGE